MVQFQYNIQFYDRVTASCTIKHTGHVHCFPLFLVITYLIYMIISDNFCKQILLVELLTSSGDEQ